MKTPHTHIRKASLLIALMLLLLATPIWLYKNHYSNAYADSDASCTKQSSIMASQRLNPLQLFAK
jgi:hypothetical protein